ncbi:MAG: hypothetical protein HY738_09940 [Bacteroidia bacterium]|nr:hypothetical protein [Bacteroidia bacterium]
MVIHLFLLFFLNTCYNSGNIYDPDKLQPADKCDVYVRFKVIRPTESFYYIRLGGFIHIQPWYLRQQVFPDKSLKYKTNEYTEWIDICSFSQGLLHNKVDRSGGLAEFPNISVEFIFEEQADSNEIIIELSDHRKKKIYKAFHEIIHGNTTSFLVSPDIKKDFSELECASEMTERHLRWAMEISEGKNIDINNFFIQTAFYAPQREELNLKEAEVLDILGFNVISNQTLAVSESYNFNKSYHFHNISVNPAISEDIIINTVSSIKQQCSNYIEKPMPVFFSDEMICWPLLDTNRDAIKNFVFWLKENEISPAFLGLDRINEIDPIENPKELSKRQALDGIYANRCFYLTSKFRQEKANEILKQYTELIHQMIDTNLITSTLVADHPYFSGTGMGMGMNENPAWGGYPLAMDWFGLARDSCIDMASIEDWMGLQYMYGPDYTWEGFQLIGFQASIFRSAGNKNIPIMAWITPGNYINTVLKASSALCQGVKHFFYWTYGPTATGTENYWSDLKGEYEAIYRINSQISKIEDILVNARQRDTKIAILYSLSSDLWQPFGYIHMLERRGIYLSLTHSQFMVDFISDEDILLGKLSDYDILYISDPCMLDKAASIISKWVYNGGTLFASGLSGIYNEYMEKKYLLNDIFGIKKINNITVQNADYHIRGALNKLKRLDYVHFVDWNLDVYGTKINFEPCENAIITCYFKDSKPAGTKVLYGKGSTSYIGTCPGIIYIREAKFKREQLSEQWNQVIRSFINNAAQKTNPMIKCNTPVIETGIYDSEGASIIVLANFQYKKINNLEVEFSGLKEPEIVYSYEQGQVIFNHFEEDRKTIKFNLQLDLNDIIIVYYKD